MSKGLIAPQRRLLEGEIKSVNKISELSTDGQTLFNFLCLIVDIKYKHKYGKQFEHTTGKGYKLGDLEENK